MGCELTLLQYNRVGCPVSHDICSRFQAMKGYVALSILRNKHVVIYIIVSCTWIGLSPLCPTSSHCVFDVYPWMYGLTPRLVLHITTNDAVSFQVQKGHDSKCKHWFGGCVLLSIKTAP